MATGSPPLPPEDGGANVVHFRGPGVRFKGRGPGTGCPHAAPGPPDFRKLYPGTRRPDG